MEQTKKKLQKESDIAYKFLSNFCVDYCKDEEERKEFYKNLSEYLNAEIRIREIL